MTFSFIGWQPSFLRKQESSIFDSMNDEKPLNLGTTNSIKIAQFRLKITLLDSRFHGNDVFIHRVVVVIPAEAGIQYI